MSAGQWVNEFHRCASAQCDELKVKCVWECCGATLSRSDRLIAHWRMESLDGQQEWHHLRLRGLRDRGGVWDSVKSTSGQPAVLYQLVCWAKLSWKSSCLFCCNNADFSFSSTNFWFIWFTLTIQISITLSSYFLCVVFSYWCFIT